MNIFDNSEKNKEYYTKLLQFVESQQKKPYPHKNQNETNEQKRSNDGRRVPWCSRISAREPKRNFVCKRMRTIKRL